MADPFTEICPTCSRPWAHHTFTGVGNQPTCPDPDRRQQQPGRQPGMPSNLTEGTSQSQLNPQSTRKKRPLGNLLNSSSPEPETQASRVHDPLVAKEISRRNKEKFGAVLNSPSPEPETRSNIQTAQTSRVPDPRVAKEISRRNKEKFGVVLNSPSPEPETRSTFEAAQAPRTHKPAVAHETRRRVEVQYGTTPNTLSSATARGVADKTFPSTTPSHESALMLKLSAGNWVCECGDEFARDDVKSYSSHMFEEHGRYPCISDPKCPDSSTTAAYVRKHRDKIHPQTSSGQKRHMPSCDAPKGEQCTAYFDAYTHASVPAKHREKHILKTQLVAAYAAYMAVGKSSKGARSRRYRALPPPLQCGQKTNEGATCPSALPGFEKWVFHVENKEGVHSAQSSVTCRYQYCGKSIPIVSLRAHVDKEHIKKDEFCLFPGCPERFQDIGFARKHAFTNHVEHSDDMPGSKCKEPGCTYGPDMTKPQAERKDELEAHRAKHIIMNSSKLEKGEDVYSFVCPADNCHAGFSTAAEAKNHARYLHPKDNPDGYLCCFVAGCEAEFNPKEAASSRRTIQAHMKHHKKYYNEYGCWPDGMEATFDARVLNLMAPLFGKRRPREQPSQDPGNDDDEGDDDDDDLGRDKRPRGEKGPQERQDRSQRTGQGRAPQIQSTDRSGQGRRQRSGQTRDGGSKERSQADEKRTGRPTDTLDPDLDSSSRASSGRSSQSLSRAARPRDPSTSSSVSTIDEKAKRSDRTGTREGHGKSSTATSTPDTRSSKVATHSVDAKLTKSSRERAEPSSSSVTTKLAKMSIKEDRTTTAKYAPANGPSTQSSVPSGSKTVVKGTKKEKTAKTKVQKEKAPV